MAEFLALANLIVLSGLCGASLTCGAALVCKALKWSPVTMNVTVNNYHSGDKSAVD